jgi:hypothetical protein
MLLFWLGFERYDVQQREKIIRGGNMKNLLIILILTVSVATASAQITVSQQFIDDSNAAFREVIALRTANTALVGQVKAEQEAKDANALLAKSQAAFIDILKADNADLRKLKCDSTSIFWVVKIKRCR